MQFSRLRVFYLEHILDTHCREWFSKMGKKSRVKRRTLLKKGDEPYWNEQAFKDIQAVNLDVMIIQLG